MTYAIIMAGGVGERFWPRSRANRPKQLLHLSNSQKSLIQETCERLFPLVEREKIFIVTNNKFFIKFLEWKSSLESNVKVTIVNDRTISNEDRLGSLVDIKFVVENMNIPKGFCNSAWLSIYNNIRLLSFGFDLPWFKEKGVAVNSCIDGFRPVIFKLERI